MTFINRLSLQFFLSVRTFNFRNPYLALRWYSLGQVYPYSFLFNLPHSKFHCSPLRLSLFIVLHFMGSVLSPLFSGLGLLLSLFFKWRMQGIEENLGSVLSESSFCLDGWVGTCLGTGFLGEGLCQVWGWTEDPRLGRVACFGQHGAFRSDGGCFWAAAFGTTVKSVRFHLPVWDGGSLGQGSLCQPRSQGGLGLRGPVNRATVNSTWAGNKPL